VPVRLGGPSLGFREKFAAWRQISSGQLAQGAKVAEFEKSFRSVSGASFSVAVNSGTSALHLGLLSAGIGPGDEVIVPSFTFAATANSVALTGATPVFCDVEEDFFTLDPTSVESAITSNTRGIMPVHLYGQMSDMNRLTEIANDKGLLIFEDAAQAHGARLDERPAGSWGEFAAFSFYPTKNMTTIEGGLVSTSNPQLAKNVQLLRNQGMLEKYKNEVAGFNNRMTEVSAAIGLVQLDRLQKFNEKRSKNASFYLEKLAHLPQIVLPKIRPNSEHVFHQFTIRVLEDREFFSGELRKLGIDTAVYYPKPVHELPAYNQQLSLPVTSFLSTQVLSLPVGPTVTLAQIEKVCNAIERVLA
jgi:perosamine synthetase